MERSSGIASYEFVFIEEQKSYVDKASEVLMSALKMIGYIALAYIGLSIAVSLIVNFVVYPIIIIAAFALIGYVYYRYHYCGSSKEEIATDAFNAATYAATSAANTTQNYIRSNLPKAATTIESQMEAMDAQWRAYQQQWQQQ